MNGTLQKEIDSFLSFGNVIVPPVRSTRLADAEASRRRDWHFWKEFLQFKWAQYYIRTLRAKSSDTRRVNAYARLERALFAPETFIPANADRQAFFRDDLVTKPASIDPEAVNRLHELAMTRETYYDVYNPKFRWRQSSERPPTVPMLYLSVMDYFFEESFWDVVASPVIPETCGRVMGRNAKISWAWIWVSVPSDGDPYQNQNWHRDCREPFAFMRVFVPLNAVRTVEDGPTNMYIGSSHYPGLCDEKRYTTEQVAAALPAENMRYCLTEVGDVYFANTFCIHRGTPPQNMRALLSLLVSYQRSDRTRGMPRVPISKIPDRHHPVLRKHRRFYSLVVDFAR
jgi:hypothetical protein